MPGSGSSTVLQPLREGPEAEPNQLDQLVEAQYPAENVGLGGSGFCYGGLPAPLR